MFADAAAAANAGAAVIVDRPTFMQSIRGMPQLVVGDKVYQLNRTKRNADGRIYKRYWNCKEKSVCSANAITEHSLTPADDCTEASIENLVLKGDHVFICIYMLLTHKSEEIYTHAFSILNAKIQEFHILKRTHKVMSDFESGLIPAIRNVLHLSTDGCIFHMSQAAYRKITELGLKVILILYVYSNILFI